MQVPRSLAIRTSYSHHSGDAGYKQILKFTRPAAIIGVDEHQPQLYNKWKWNYRFLFEFDAKKWYRKNGAELLHILYGEEYYRFSARLFRHIPIVVTFHQPGDRLQQEITTGDVMGRMYRLAHNLNRNRFRKVSAAIVMTEEQKNILAQAIEPEKIFVIPLGADIRKLAEVDARVHAERLPLQIVTVGNWLRDFDFYFRFTAWCAQHRPQWKFILINQKFPDEMRARSAPHTNVTYLPGVADEELYRIYKSSAVHFLPFTGAAGNNSLNEGLAMGCPVVTNILNTSLSDTRKFIATFETGSPESAAASLDRFLVSGSSSAAETAQLAKKAIMALDWSEIAARTVEVYRLAGDHFRNLR